MDTKMLMFGAVALFLAWVLSLPCEASENIMKMETAKFESYSQKPSSGIYKVCLEGHVYYKNCWHSCDMAPKLTDDGKPVKCKGKRRKCQGGQGFFGCDKWVWEE